MNAMQLIRRTRAHLVWSNHRLLDAAAALRPEQLEQRFEIGMGTLMATLAHLYGAERSWLAAIRGDARPVSPFGISFDGVAPLREAWRKLEEEWEAVLEELTEADLDRMVAKRSSLQPTGPAIETPLGDILLHVATHGSYTMAQAKNIMRHLGVTDLPDVMLITMSRNEHHPAAR